MLQDTTDDCLEPVLWIRLGGDMSVSLCIFIVKEKDYLNVAHYSLVRKTLAKHRFKHPSFLDLCATGMPPSYSLMYLEHLYSYSNPFILGPHICCIESELVQDVD